MVRTVTVGMRGKDKGVGTLTDIPKAHDEHRLGVQRIAVICPAEDQDLGAEDLVAEDRSTHNQDLDAEDRIIHEQDLDTKGMDAEHLVAEERIDY